MKLKTLMIAGVAAFLLNTIPVMGSVNIDDEEYNIIYSTDYLNVRRGPSTTAEIVGTLKPNTAMKRIASVGEWDTVIISDIEYYVCNDYITIEEPKNAESIERIEPIKAGYLQKCVAVKPKKTYLGNYELTAYCSCAGCCGNWGGTITASGTTPTAGRTVACNSLPFGTKVMINNHIYTVEDTGGMASNVIDIYMGDHSNALAFGRQSADVYLVE